MPIQLLTLLMLIFVILIYFYIYLVKKNLVFSSKLTKQSKRFIVIMTFIPLLLIIFSVNQSFDHILQLVLSSLLVFSFYFEPRGITKEGLITNLFDRKGTSFYSITQLVVIISQDQKITVRVATTHKKQLTTFHFNVSLEKLLLFLNEKLDSTTEVDILFEEELK